MYRPWPGAPGLARAAVVCAAFAACTGTPRAQPPTARMAYDDAVRGNVGGAQSYREQGRGIPGFAGVYARECDVVVRVTEPTAGIEATARERFTRDLSSADGCAGQVRIEAARYAWTDLAAWHQRMALGGTPGVLAHAPNVIRNRVVVAVADEAAAGRVREVVGRAGVPADAVLVAITGPVPMPPRRYVLAVGARLGGEPGGVPGMRAAVLGADGRTVFGGTTDAAGDLVVPLQGGGEYEVRVVAPPGHALAPGEPSAKRVRVGVMDVDPDWALFYFVRDPPGSPAGDPMK